MSLITLRSIPTRMTTGAYILHSGLEKWRGDEERAKGMQGFASSAYPFVTKVQPTTFLKALAAAEIAIGAALINPIISNKKAGLLLTAFAGGLMGLYAKTPGLREPGSVWPTQNGIAVSKDVWLLGIGAALLAD